MLQHEDIIDAAVVGKKHDRYGELPTAFVVKKPGSQVTAEDVQHFIASKFRCVQMTFMYFHKQCIVTE